MKRPGLVALALMAVVSPANAHLLKVFATVEDGAVAGYGFFVGGGRPEEATVIITGKDGQELHRGKTGARGVFSWSPPVPQPLTVTIDAGEGHVAQRDIGAERFDLVRAAGGSAAGADPASGKEAPGTDAPTGLEGSLPSHLDDMIAKAVDRAVARQIRPLMEAYAEAEGRARLTDIVGGVGMIIGLAGLAMWITARRRLQSGAGGGPEATG